MLIKNVQVESVEHFEALLRDKKHISLNYNFRIEDINFRTMKIDINRVMKILKEVIGESKERNINSIEFINCYFDLCAFHIDNPSTVIELHHSILADSYISGNCKRFQIYSSEVVVLNIDNLKAERVLVYESTADRLFIHTDCEIKQIEVEFSRVNESVLIVKPVTSKLSLKISQVSDTYILVPTNTVLDKLEYNTMDTVFSNIDKEVKDEIAEEYSVINNTQGYSELTMNSLTVKTRSSDNRIISYVPMLDKYQIGCIFKTFDDVVNDIKLEYSGNKESINDYIKAVKIIKEISELKIK